MKKVVTLNDLKNTSCWRLNPHLHGEAEKKIKRSKYNNTKVEYNGEVFDSLKERHRHITNEYRQQIGEIRDLQRQVVFRLESANKKVCDYVADSTYYIVATGEFVVEDVKSSYTRRLAPYRLKKKLMEAQYQITIKEI